MHIACSRRPWWITGLKCLSNRKKHRDPKSIQGLKLTIGCNCNPSLVIQWENMVLSCHITLVDTYFPVTSYKEVTFHHPRSSTCCAYVCRKKETAALYRPQGSSLCCSTGMKPGVWHSQMILCLLSTPSKHHRKTAAFTTGKGGQLTAGMSIGLGNTVPQYTAMAIT